MKNRWSDRGETSRKKAQKAQLVWWGVGVAVALVVAVTWLWGGEEEAEQPESAAEEQAMAQAAQVMGEAFGGAKEQHDSGEAMAIVEALREEEAQQAAWEEGEEVHMIGDIQQDYSLYVTLLGRNVPEGQVFQMVSAMEEEFNFGRSRPGDQWEATVRPDGRIEEFRYETSPESVWVTTLIPGEGYETEELEIDVEVKHREVAGEVEGSFWMTMESMGYGGVLPMRFMQVFEYSIDFNTETRDGDHFAMVVEEIYLDDEFLRYGRVVAATYIGMRGVREAYYYETDEESGYYAADGESLQRQFLRSPLEVTRVTSNFGRRVHPITGDERMHHGVDYGAPTGTRVRAVADGRVTFAGWRGGYGKLLIIEHSGGYSTRFAHLSAFDVSSGQRVSQGQLVARSGNTGNSTAPHLHYEMLQHGQHIDPLTVEATSGDPLRGANLEAFKADVVAELGPRLEEVLGEESASAVMALRGEEEVEDDE